MPIENEELITEAQELELNTDDYDDEESLQTAIDEKKEEIKREEEKNKDPDFLKSEAKKAYLARDKAKREARTLKSKIQKLEDKLESTVDQEKVDELQEQLNTLLEEKKQREEEEEQKKLEKADELERTKIRAKKEVESVKSEFQKEIDKFKTQFEELNTKTKKKDEEIEDLRRVKLDNELLSSAERYKAIKPSQIVKMLRNEAYWDNDLKGWRFAKYDEKGKQIDELESEEFVKEFLEDPDNDNLVEAEVNKGGTGHQKTDTSKPPVKKTKTGEYDPKDPKIIEEAEHRDMTPEHLIAVWIKRDEKLKKIEERRKERDNKRRNL